ncbi:hypothetical protein OUZ56_005924 [Daphnia magna]|uniref:MADF domain-containing protein n=1 Tax=Daphnia magna TaxID=35525 RepID=A0ABQ9YU52_9CRUS|nr:hypothetical protein OUZ56_005924 [Daphnia magna]
MADANENSKSPRKKNIFKWKKQDTELLIQEVEQDPVLYDTTMKDYKKGDVQAKVVKIGLHKINSI